jgi:hypothetical protein
LCSATVGHYAKAAFTLRLQPLGNIEQHVGDFLVAAHGELHILA